MPAFAPVYTAPTSQRTFVAREQKRDRKRTRDGRDENDDEDDQSSSEPDPDEESASRRSHSVNKRDPYHVAGWPRNRPLPGGNFPHAPVKEPRSTGLTTEEELARLNPPLYVANNSNHDQSGSLKRRHLDNLTAILHKCMLKGDWKRASRAWGLLLRTEIQGRGLDVRQNGRWLIGAEILMRRNQDIEQRQVHPRIADRGDNHIDGDQCAATTAVPVVSDQGFELARQYYERLILQYPHLQRARHDATNALAIYPALFNVWMYEVHDRAQRARQKARLSEEPSEADLASIPDDCENEDDAERKRNLMQIRHLELDQALPIVHRMDELMGSPPYDTSTELLHLRATVALWLADMHKDVAKFLISSTNGSGTSSEDETSMDSNSIEARASRKRHEVQVASERHKAKKIFSGLRSAGFDVSKDVLDALEDDEDLCATHDMD